MWCYYPENAYLIERLEWGNMYGFITEIKEGSKIISSTKGQSIAKLAEILPKTTAKYKEIKDKFEANLPKDLVVYKEYHALIVEHAKNFYKKKPYDDKVLR